MEIEVRNQLVETIEINGNPQHIRGVKTCKSFKTWLQARINDQIRFKNLEEEMKLRAIMGAYEHFHKGRDKNYKLELEIISGWKGEGSTEVYKGFDNDFRIMQPIKDKTTGIIKKTPHTVKKEDLNAMIRIIKKLPLNEPTSCYDIAKLMGLDWKNDIWKNRTKIYFAKYYFPIKILEKLRVINYSGKGVITRIK